MSFDKHNFLKKIAAISSGLAIGILPVLSTCQINALLQADVDAVAENIEKMKVECTAADGKLAYYCLIKNFFRKNKLRTDLDRFSLVEQKLNRLNFFKIDQIEKILLAGAMIIDFNKKVAEFDSKKFELNSNINEICNSLVWLHKFYTFVIENTESMLKQGIHPEKGAFLENTMENYKAKHRVITEIFANVMPDGYLNFTEDASRIWNRASSKAYINSKDGIVSKNWENLLYYTVRYHVCKACSIEKVFDEFDLEDTETKIKEEGAKPTKGAPSNVSEVLETSISEGIKQMHIEKMFFELNDESKFLEGVKDLVDEDFANDDTSIPILKFLYASRFESKMILCENYSSPERRQRIQNISMRNFFETIVFYAFSNNLDWHFRDYYYSVVRRNILIGAESTDSNFFGEMLNVMGGDSKYDYDYFETRLDKAQRAAGDKPIDPKALVYQMKECKYCSNEFKDMMAAMYESRRSQSKGKVISESKRKEVLERISDSLDILDICARLNEKNAAYKEYVQEVRKYASELLKMKVPSNIIKFKSYYDYYKNHPEKLQPGTLDTSNDVPEGVRTVNDKIKENMYYMLKESEEILNQEEIKYKKAKKRKKISAGEDIKKEPEKRTEAPKKTSEKPKISEEKNQTSAPAKPVDSEKPLQSPEIKPNKVEENTHITPKKSEEVSNQEESKSKKKKSSVADSEKPLPSPEIKPNKVEENTHSAPKKIEEVSNQEESKHKKHKKKKSAVADSKKEPEKRIEAPKKTSEKPKISEEKNQTSAPAKPVDTEKPLQSSEIQQSKIKQIQEKEEFQKNQVIRSEKWKEEVARKKIVKEKDKVSKAKDQILEKTESEAFFEKYPHKIVLPESINSYLEMLRRKGNGGTLLSRVEEFIEQGIIKPGGHLKRLGENRFEQYLTRNERIGFEIGKNEDDKFVAIIRSIGGHFDSAKEVDKAFERTSFGGIRLSDKSSSGSE